MLALSSLFLKGDTHGSKADPPRFKDHTKLVCARHSRSGRKKYVKKHPDRVRKVPSRKVCLIVGSGDVQIKLTYNFAFSLKGKAARHPLVTKRTSTLTRFVPVVRPLHFCFCFIPHVNASDISQHSHEIGPANLPFTRRGRKAAVQQEKERGRNRSVTTTDQDQPIASSSNPPSAVGAPQPSNQHVVSSFSSAVSMLAPLPGQTYPNPQPYGYQPAVHAYPPIQQNHPQERWDNMTTLFQTVREHARSFEYPAASVAALETVLIRLYLESPMGLSPQQTMGSLIQNGLRAQPTAGQTASGHPNLNGTGNDGPSTTSTEEGS